VNNEPLMSALICNTADAGEAKAMALRAVAAYSKFFKVITPLGDATSVPPRYPV
jgi:hypothetical protein